MRLLQPPPVRVVAGAGRPRAGRSGNDRPFRDVIRDETASGYTRCHLKLSRNEPDRRRDWVDLAAPGQDITSPAPGGRFARWNGTSLATPFVTGQAALILSQNPNIKPNKLVEAIAKTAKKVHKRKLRNGAIDIPASLDHARSHWK